jgi:iron(III) transport system ATP-binding protein
MTGKPAQETAPARAAGPGARTEPAAAAAISVRGLSKSFRDSRGTTVNAVRNLDLEVMPGEMVVLLGPSGCGKTTLLRCIAGLERPDRGRIDIAGRTVFDGASKQVVPPERRPISMMFQSYALWPHMTGRENVAYPLRSRGTAKAEIGPLAQRALDMVGVGNLSSEYPATMSGGQQQRVALARALVGSSAVILFDEPLSNVDAKMREEVRGEMSRMREALGFAGLYVTHDQTEALALADRIVVLKEGSIEQVGSPQEIYPRPRSRYVGNFVGSANEIAGTVSERSAGRVRVETALGTVWATDYSGRDWSAGEDVVLLFRPSAVGIGSTPVTQGNSWDAKVVSSTFLGSHVELTLEVGTLELKAWVSSRSPGTVGESLRIDVAPAELIVLDPGNQTPGLASERRSD